MNLIKRIGLVFSICLISHVQLQSQSLSLSRLNSEDGLSNNMISSIVQDESGFMWFGSKEGLNRYDGSSIRVYYYSPDDSSTLLDNRVLNLHIDKQGTLWVGTSRGLSKYNENSDNFTRYPVSFADVESFKREPLGSIAEDHDGNLWYGNHNGGVYKFIKNSKQYFYYDNPSKSISNIFVDSLNNVLVGTRDCELYIFDPRVKSFTRLDLPEIQPTSIPDNYIWKMFENSRGELILNTSHGIYSVNTRMHEVTKLSFLTIKSSTFRNNEIRAVNETEAHKYWVGTWGKGLYYCDTEKESVSNFQVDPRNENSLSNNDVNVIFQDRGGVIWVGTQEGLTIIDPAKDIFKKYQNDPGNSNSLHFNFITSFCEDRHNNIWIGTYGAGVSKFNANEEKFEALISNQEDSKGLINNAVRAICEDEKGNIWIGTMKGVDRYNPRTGRHTYFQQDPNDLNSLSNNDVLCIINGNSNDLWIGTYGGGLCHVDLSTESKPIFTNYTHSEIEPNSICSNYIRSLALAENGTLWIGSLGSGIDKFVPDSGIFINYPLDPGLKEALVEKHINCILNTGDNYLWLGTNEGLVKLALTSSEITTFTTAQGLPDDNIAEIQEDKYGNLWVSTYRGIVKLEIGQNEELIIEKYNSENGLQGNKFNINASLQDHNGNLYFGGTTGFNIIYPEQIKSNNFIPPVVLTNLSIFNKPVKINERINRRVILNKSIQIADEIVLTNKDRIITIEFAALSYSEKERNTYMYYLEGVDKDWVTVDSKRNFATYSNLPTGSHLFRVKAANSDGIWNEAGTSLLIKVLLPWKTWYAFLTYAIVIIFGLIVIRRYTLKQSELQYKLEIESIERRKTEELNQLKFQFFTNISHEVRTPLTLILGPLEKLIK